MFYWSEANSICPNNFQHDFFCPLWKRGHIVLLLSVCLYVGRSVDQVLSAQYLLTPSLDQYQTYCRGCPQKVNDPFWFSGHMFKGQSQTTFLCPVCCPLYISLSRAYFLRTSFASTEKIDLNCAPWGHICFWIISCHFNKLFNVVLDYVLFKKCLENVIIAKYSKVIMNFFQNSVLTSISVKIFLILPLFSLPFCCISDRFWYQYPFNWGKYCQFEQIGNSLWIY